jgi:hypothetical protein
MDAVEDYARRWIKREVDQEVVMKRRVGAVTSQRVLKVLFYVNISDNESPLFSEKQMKIYKNTIRKV